MPSTYTNNLGIQKPGTGEQSGSWGDTVNTNSDILDVGINGVLSLSLTGTSSTLTTSDGIVSNGQYKVLSLTGTPSGTHTITISPNDSQKIYFVYNTTAQTVVFTQGSGGNVTLLAGDSTIIYANGAGATAAVVSLADHLAMSSARITGGTITGITDLAVADGGTGASDAATARANLGLTIGTNVQAYDAGLQSISGLVTAADRMIYTTASDTYAVTTLTSYARTLLDDTSAATARTTLGLGTISTQASTAVAITGGTIDGTAIGNTTPAAGAFTGLTAPSLTTAGTLAISATGANIITASTNGTERVRIDSAGGVGVGATPSVWRTSEKSIDIGGYGAITGGSGTNLARIYANSYTDAASVIRYKNNSLASMYSQGNGIHSWFVAPTGLAGDPITFTQAVTLHNSGGVSIGNTTDPGATNLSVTGALTLGTALTIANGGTGATDAATARTNLGLAIGSNVQAYDAGLQSISGLVTAADRMIYTTALDTYAVTTLTSYARTLLDDADAATARATLGLGTLATQSGTFSGTSSGTNTGDQNIFQSIAVFGHATVVADTTADTLTLAAGAGITITTNETTDTITITGTGGTVTSVAVSGGTTGLTTSGGPITGSGTITLAGTLALANGGTGATTAAAARTNLGAQADLGFTPVQQGGGTSMGTNKVYVGWNGIGLFAQVDTTSLGRLVTNVDATGATGTYSSTQLFAPGNAPLFACRAWVNFNGQGVVAIRGSGNVSSITDFGTGSYTVNFTTAMIDANYAPNITFFSPNTTTYPYAPVYNGMSVGGIAFQCITASIGLFDPEFVNVTIFR